MCVPEDLLMVVEGSVLLEGRQLLYASGIFFVMEFVPEAEYRW